MVDLAGLGNLRLIAARLDLVEALCTAVIERKARVEERNTRLRHTLETSPGESTEADIICERLLRVLEDFPDERIDSMDKLEQFGQALGRIPKNLRSLDGEGMVGRITHAIGHLRNALASSVNLNRHLDALSELVQNTILPDRDKADLDLVISLRHQPEALSLRITPIAAEWRDRSTAIYEDVRRRKLLQPVAGIDAVLIVENEEKWATDIRNLVITPLQNKYSFLVELVDDKSKALEVISRWERSGQLQGAIVVSDLEIPEYAGERPQVEHGESIVRYCLGKVPVIVLTTHGYLYDSFVKLGQPGVDFVEKGGPVGALEEWAESLATRIEAHLVPLRMEECALQVLGFTGTTIVFNGVEIELTELEFGVIQALSTWRSTGFDPVFSDGLIAQIPYDEYDPDSDPHALLRAAMTGSTPNSGDQRYACPASELGKRLILNAVRNLDLSVWKDPERVVERARDVLSTVCAKIENSVRALDLSMPTGKLYEVIDPKAEQDELSIILNPHTSVIRTPHDYLERRGAIQNADSFRILLVEDDPDCRKAAERTLRDYGFSLISIAGDRDGAEKYLAYHECELAIFDLEIPFKEGQESLVDEGMLLRRVSSRLDRPPQVILFSRHDRSHVIASLHRSADGKASITWDGYLARRMREFVQKQGSLDDDCARLAIAAGRAYEDYRRRTWSIPTGDKSVHHVEIPRMPWPPVAGADVADCFWVDGKKLCLPDGGVYSQPRRIQAARLFHFLGLHDNLSLHVDSLILEMVNLGVFPPIQATMDYKQLLDRSIGAVNKALKSGGFKPDEILISTGRSYMLAGVVSFR